MTPGHRMSRALPMALLVGVALISGMTGDAESSSPVPGQSYVPGKMSSTMSRVLFDEAIEVAQGWDEVGPAALDIPALTLGNVPDDATALIISVLLHTRHMGLSFQVGSSAGDLREVHRITAYGDGDNFTQITEVVVPYNGSSLTYFHDWIDEYNPFVHGSANDMEAHTDFQLFVKGYMSPKQGVYHLRDVSTASGGVHYQPELCQGRSDSGTGYQSCD